MEKQFIKLKDAAEILGIKTSTLYKLTSNRLISFYKPGGKIIFFLAEDLQEYLSNSRIPAKSEIEKKFLAKLKIGQ